MQTTRENKHQKDLRMTFGKLRSSPFILRNLQKVLMALALLPWLSIAIAQPVPKVICLIPDPPGVSPFWTQTIEIMRAVAEDLEIHYGLDFAQEPGVISQTQFKPIIASNAEEYRKKLNNLNWRQIDFKRFSKKYNPRLKNHDFTLDELLNSPET